MANSTHRISHLKILLIAYILCAITLDLVKSDPLDCNKLVSAANDAEATEMAKVYFNKYDNKSESDVPEELALSSKS